MKLSNATVFVTLVYVIALIYWQSLPYPFQFDDYNVIVNQPKVHSLEAFLQSMPSVRPLLKLSYLLNWHFSKNPFYFRLVNVVFHLITSYFVYIFARQILPFIHKKHPQHHVLIAFFTAVLFAAHPAHTEVVVYVSSRSTGLMAMLGLISLYFFLNGLINNTKHLTHFMLGFLFWCLAVLVKEVALVLPLLGLWLTVFIAPNKLKQVRLLSFEQKTLYGLLLVVPIVFVLTQAQYLGVLRAALDIQALSMQAIMQPIAHWHYLTHTIWGLGLNVDYSGQYSGQHFFGLQNIIASALLLALIVLACLKRQHWPMLSFAVGWWFICMLPTNSLIYRPDLVNDRQIYLASIGILLLLCDILLGFFGQFAKHIAIAVTLIFALFFMINSYRRNHEYQTEISLWQASLRQYPLNARAWNNLGYAYLQAGDKIKAKDCYKNALLIDKNHLQAFNNLQILN